MGTLRKKYNSYKKTLAIARVFYLFTYFILD